MSAKLRELGNKRVAKAIRAIRNVGKLGRYKPTSGQTNAAFSLLGKELDAAISRWKAPAQAVEEINVALPEA